MGTGVKQQKYEADQSVSTSAMVKNVWNNTFISA
jgi:hypothetical protein